MEDHERDRPRTATIAGTVSNVRSSSSRSLRSTASGGPHAYSSLSCLGVEPVPAAPTYAGAPVLERQHQVGLGERRLRVVAGDHPGAAARRARSAARPARSRPGRGWPAARRAAAARGRCRTARHTARRCTMPRLQQAHRLIGAALHPHRVEHLLDPLGARPRAGARGRRGSRARSGRGTAAARGRAARAARAPRTRAAAAARRTAGRSPPCGRSSVARIRSSVDLPAPLRPSTASVAPGGTRHRDVPQRGPLAEVAGQTAQLHPGTPSPGPAGQGGDINVLFLFHPRAAASRRRAPASARSPETAPRSPSGCRGS